MPRTRSSSCVLLLAGAVLCGACTTSSLGRAQLKLFPDSHVQMMGLAAFTKLVETEPITKDGAVNVYVQCVVQSIARAPGAASRTRWEVVVLEKDSANAFALPGGKIGVHRGLLRVASDRDQLATVIGHEMAHVLEGHSNERVSAEFFAGQLKGALATLADTSNPQQVVLLEALGVGSQAGLLHYSRTHESEADVLGLDLMARAGFDPAASGSSQPELLSTHPAPATRIRELAARVPAMAVLRDRARAAGLQPACTPAR